MIEYKGYFIEKDLMGNAFYTVQYCGDDIVFCSIQEAKTFIDEISAENE